MVFQYLMHFLFLEICYIYEARCSLLLWLLCPLSLLRPLQKRVPWLARTFLMVEKGREKKKKWTASVHTAHMSKPVITFVFKVIRNGLLRYILQTCDNVRVQSATQWTASVHTLQMSKPVITFVFKVLRNGLLRYIRRTCPNL